MKDLFLGNFRAASLGLVALFALLTLAACGSNNSGNSAAPITSLGTCPAGQVLSQAYGCLPQANCPVGQGLYNGQCISLTATTLSTSCSAGSLYTAYGCQPQGNCAAGSASYNGSCIPAITNASSICPAGSTYSAGVCTATVSSSSSCQGSCPIGQVQTSYGCLPQSNCYSCFGYAQGYCIAPTGYSYYLGY